MIGRARFCNGSNREMPRCTALNRLGEPCKAARMRGRSTCFRHSGGAEAKRARLAAVHLSGDVDRIQRAARQGFQLDLLDRDLPAVSDACRWIWARMSWGLISDGDLTTKLARLRIRIMEVGDAFDHSR